jgi:hypothetical protein
MKNYTFGFETQTLLEQFIGAFNDIIIKRYDHNNTLVEPTSGFKVLYVYSPKQRVFNSLTTPAPGGLTVPVVAVTIGGISRDSSRVFNKNDGFNIQYENPNIEGPLLKKILQPVPINITVNMTIVTKYQLDMDQILNNFIPYTDPYIIISWKIPNISESTIPYELRNEILWSGNVNINYPQDLAPTAPFRITAETSFTIKGWFFKKIGEPYKKIYTIQSDYFLYNGRTITPQTSSIISDFENIFGLGV